MRISGNYGFKRLTPVFLLLAASLASCSKAPLAEKAPAVHAAERGFEVRGILRGIDIDRKSVTVEHEDIAGFMPSMTMPFSVKTPEELRGFSVGNAVTFRFIVTDSDSWVTGLKAIDPTTVHLPQSQNQPEKKTGAPRLKEGDKLPEFSLFDQSNQPLTRETLAGKATLLTFIFTRCPVPNFCPLMSRNFSELQTKIKADHSLGEQVRLLSISFDPLDSPETLAHYASTLSADPALWWHAGGTAAETAKLTHAFSVYVQADGGSFSHGLCTALVSPDGTIVKIWRGNDWSVNEVWQALLDLNRGKMAKTAGKEGKF